MTLRESQAESVVSAIKLLWQKNCLAAGDGNFSFKMGKEIWISPSGCRKCELKASDFVKLDDSKKASSEALMHKKVFERADKASFVFHAHPPAAIAFSISHQDAYLPENLMSELILSVGRIPVVPYARPGSLDMGKNLEPFLPDSRVLILKHHGALTWGETAEEALNGMERLEHTCEILLKAKAFSSSLSTLSEEEVEWLKNKRKILGERTL